jgi:hypothetical protein
MEEKHSPDNVTCCADKNHGVNYGKEHVWVSAQRGGDPTESCLYCGRWREDEIRS